MAFRHEARRGHTHTGTEVSVALDNLSDVTAPSPSVNDLIQWNGSAWINVDVTTAAGSLDHGGLAGLGDDDHPQYGHLSQAETVAGQWTFTSRLDLTSTTPQIRWDATGAAADESLWRQFATGTEWIFSAVSDDGTAETQIFNITRTGEVVDDVLMDGYGWTFVNNVPVNWDLPTPGTPTQFLKFGDNLQGRAPSTPVVEGVAASRGRPILAGPYLESQINTTGTAASYMPMWDGMGYDYYETTSGANYVTTGGRFTNQPRFYFNGTGESVAPNQAVAGGYLDFGKRDFSIEVSVNFTDKAEETTYNSIINDWFETGTRRCWRLYWNNTATAWQFQYTTDGSTPVTVLSYVDATVANGTWYDVCVTRDTDADTGVSTMYMFVDGALVDSAVVTGVVIWNNGGQENLSQINIGGEHFTSGSTAMKSMDGYIGNIYVTIDAANYTSAYTVTEIPTQQEIRAGDTAWTTYQWPSPRDYVMDPRQTTTTHDFGDFAGANYSPDGTKFLWTAENGISYQVFGNTSDHWNPQPFFGPMHPFLAPTSGPQPSEGTASSTSYDRLGTVLTNSAGTKVWMMDLRSVSPTDDQVTLWNTAGWGDWSAITSGGGRGDEQFNLTDGAAATIDNIQDLCWTGAGLYLLVLEGTSAGDSNFLHMYSVSSAYDLGTNGANLTHLAELDLNTIMVTYHAGLIDPRAAKINEAGTVVTVMCQDATTASKKGLFSLVLNTPFDLTSTSSTQYESKNDYRFNNMRNMWMDPTYGRHIAGVERSSWFRRWDALNPQTVLQVDFTGTNGATTATDVSPYAWPLIFNDSAAISTTVTPPGGGTGCLYLPVDDGSVMVDKEVCRDEFRFTAGTDGSSSAMTFETDFRWDTSVANHNFLTWWTALTAAVNDNVNRKWQIQFQTGGSYTGFRMIVSETGGNPGAITGAISSSAYVDHVALGSWTPAADTWYRIAVSVHGNTLKIFVDGVCIGNGQWPAGQMGELCDFGSADVIIGSTETATENVYGGNAACYYANLRYSRGWGTQTVGDYTPVAGPHPTAIDDPYWYGAFTAASGGPVTGTGFYVGNNTYQTDLRGLTVETDRPFVLRDSTAADTATFSHDGTDLTTATVGTTDWNITGLTGTMQLEADLNAENVTAVGTLTVKDALATDTIAVSHDGTDANFIFTNTAKVNFDGFSGDFELGGGDAANDINLNLSPLLGYDSRIRLFEDVAAQGGYLYGASIEYDGVANEFNLNMHNNSAAGTKLFASNRANTDLDVQQAKFNFNSATNPTFTIFDTSLADSVAMAHDGADVVFTYTNTADQQFRGLTNTFQIFNGSAASFNYVIGTGLELRDGTHLRIQDAADTDYATFSHDGTDFNTVLTNTTDWNITGITAIAAGTVDADFDAITATSYGGITEANLLDKTAAESITASWTFQAAGSAGAVRLDSTSPTLVFVESGVTADNARWDIQVNSESLACRLVDDAVTSAANWLVVERTANTVDSIAFNGPVTATSFGGITSANLLDKTATESVTGTWTFTNQLNVSGNAVEIEGVNPRVNFWETGGVADNQKWRAMANGGQFLLSAINDAENTVVNWLTVDRTGTVIDSLTTGAQLISNGSVHIRSGESLYAYDATNVDYVTLYHNGSNSFLTNNAGAMQISSASNLTQFTGGEQVRLNGGGVFRIYDAGDTDYVQQSHDGTDFTIAGTNTTDINISGFTRILVGGPKLEIQKVGGEGILLKDTGAVGTASTPYIGFDDSAGTRQGYMGYASATSGDLILVADNGDLRVSQPIKILETAAASADLAGHGQLWVKNTTPCQLWFTDDAGTDTQIV